jgi:hypothetical protein
VMFAIFFYILRLENKGLETRCHTLATDLELLLNYDTLQPGTLNVVTFSESCGLVSYLQNGMLPHTNL